MTYGWLLMRGSVQLPYRTCESSTRSYEDRDLIDITLIAVGVHDLQWGNESKAMDITFLYHSFVLIQQHTKLQLNNIENA